MTESAAAPFDPKQFLAHAPGKPGVYRMLGRDGEVLYVGKARHLKQRLASYFRSPTQLSPKTRALVGQIVAIELTTTHTETEALILENNLIKKHQPRYNILLRDDKTYPYIYLSDDEFPRLSAQRGAKRGRGRYFGPYPSMGSVRESLNLLQKLFPLRQCENSFFSHRSRPCLQYQIKRCSAPCVGLVDPAVYAEDVQHAGLFLEGKNQAVVQTLIEKMQAAAQTQEYERAARYRDQIARLRHLQERQYMEADSEDDADIVAAVTQEGAACVQVFSVRGGRGLGSQAYFPKQTQDSDAAAILAAFLPQFYLHRSRDIPPEVVLNLELEDQTCLAEALAAQRGGPVRLHAKVRGTRARWLALAEDNARVSLAQHRPTQHRERLAALALVLGLEELPTRLECFDISHTQGEATQAACVVFDSDGPRSGDYRRYNIRDVHAGDDYAAMRQALLRRFEAALETPPEDSDKPSPPLPEVLIVDGGRGQLAQAQAVLEELQLAGISLLGVVKGEGRKAEFDRLVLPGAAQALILPSDSPALHLVQQIRDEAHRFAITGHRQRRAKARRSSSLEQIAGIGAKRRQQLLSHFGGLQGVVRAGLEDLAKVPGINRQLAQNIYDAFHDNP